MLQSNFALKNQSKEKLALGGATLSTFPVIGSTTIPCIEASVALDLNLASIQLVNYFAFPLQLLLLPLFIRIGELFFSSRPILLSTLQIVTMVKSDISGVIRTLR